jgi:hypothetical protein
VAVSHHDTTPLSGEDSVHHLRGRNLIIRAQQALMAENNMRSSL